ncbi:MAG TPA: alpha-galactosidase [Naasia sp.]|jgi:alpha-galactosidase
MLPSVRHLPDVPAFALDNDGGTYAFAVGPEGEPLRHLHWGARLTDDDIRDLASASGSRWRTFDSVPRNHDEELPAWGGQRYDDVALKVTGPGGGGLRLTYAGHSLAAAGAEASLAVRLVDALQEVAVTVHYRLFADSPVLGRRVSIEAIGERRLLLDAACSATWTLPERARLNVTAVYGGWGAETQLQRAPLVRGRTVFESRKGMTGHHGQPWVALDAGASETSGEVWSAALEWSGSWKTSVQRPSEGSTTVTIGVNDFDSALEIASGATFTTPESVALRSTTGFDGMTAAWHDYQRRFVLREPELLRPVLYNSWEATEFDVGHQQQLELARIAAEMGVELFVVDDGWFGARDSAAAGLGDWTVNPRKFPDGLAPFVADVHALGMRCGLWVEPEMVNPDSDLYRAHPEWVIRFPEREPALRRGQLVLNLAREDVRDWMLETLSRLVAESGVDYLKWDANRPIADPGWGTDPAPEGRDLWTEYTLGLYGVLDTLRERHPALLIEACAGGGGRVDLGMLRRTHQVWTSDNTDALDRIPIQRGYSYVYPPQTMSAWVTDVPNFLTKRSTPLRFRFHAAMRGVLGIGGDLRRLGPEAIGEHRELVAEYTRIRPAVQQGRMHRLEGLDERGVDAVQYTSADGSLAAVLLLAPSAAFGPQHLRVRLRGLDPDGVYRHGGREVSGALLMDAGVRFVATGDYSSALEVIERVSERPAPSGSR